MGSIGRVLDNNKVRVGEAGEGPASGWTIGWVEAVRGCSFCRRNLLSSVCQRLNGARRAVRRSTFSARAAESDFGHCARASYPGLQKIHGALQ